MAKKLTEQSIDEIYGQCYTTSNVVNLSNRFDDYKKVVKESNFHMHYVKDPRNYATLIGNNVDEEQFHLLEDYCSIENLTVKGELQKLSKSTFEWCKDPDDPSIIDSIQMQTVKNTKIRNQLKNYQVPAKYRSEKPVIYEPSTLPHHNGSLVPENDILVFVKVYVPFTCRQKQSTGALGKLCLDSIIALHGSQTLDKLRDKITCLSDYSISVDMSKNPLGKVRKNAKDVYKSGFFFIENTFYNDFRDPNNKDNSRTIREWTQSRNHNMYKVAKMEDTPIGSLALRFGFPWVYQHQGDCEHLFTISDARLVNPADELNMDCYPRIMRIKPRPNRYCMTCGIYSVNWVTTSNDRLPHNPCLFCDSCFKSYNYIGGKKIGSFQAFPYPFDNDLLQSNPHEIMEEDESSLSSPAKESDNETIHQEPPIKIKILHMQTK